VSQSRAGSCVGDALDDEPALRVAAGPGVGDDASLAGSEVRLALPATSEFGRIARLAASGLALRHGFTYDDIEDLRRAVDGAVRFLLEGAAGAPLGRLSLRFVLHSSAISVDVAADHASVEAPVSLDEAARLRAARQLAGLVDRVNVSGHHVELMKRRSA
jgi:hypothetical protein